MFISNQIYRIAPLTKSLVNVCATFMTDMYLTSNQTWIAMKPKPSQMYDFFVSKLTQVLDWEEQLRQEGIIKKQNSINFVYLDEKDDIVAVTLNFQLSQYLRKKSKVKYALFDELEEYGKLLEKCLDKVEVIPGKYISGMFNVVSKKVVGSKVIMFFVVDYFHILASQGFEAMFARSSNEKALANVLKDRAQILNQMNVKLNNKPIRLSYIKWPIRTIEERIKEMNTIYGKAKL